jgi:uncharacterized protein YcfL
MRNLLLVILAVIVMVSCRSRSGHRDDHKIEEVVVMKANITQTGEQIVFEITDTVGWVVTLKVYDTHISNVLPYDDDSVLVITAYPDVDREKRITLKIE